MKTVFTSNADVIHAYAQQTQQSGRSGNVFFEGKKLYSYGYHYLLCEFITDNAVLINDKGYSVSTSKHIGITRGATSQYKEFLTSQCDLNLVYNAINNAKSKLASAKKPEIYLSEISRKWNSLNEYMKFRGWKKYANSDEQKKYKELSKLVSLLNSEGGKDKVKEFEVKQLNKAKVAERKRLKDALNDFMSYKTNWFRIGKEDFLRISQDGERVETSQGVKVPVKSAKALYKMIVAGKDIVGAKIEHYTVNSLNGHLVIGCHSINVANMHEIGKKLI